MFSSRSRPGDELDADARIASLQARIDDMRLELDRRFTNQTHITTLEIDAIDRVVKVAQETANRAVMKAEAAAERAHLESHIEGLRGQIEAQIEATKSTLRDSITSQKEALNAALASSERAILSAAAATDKAITKSEQAYDKRFELLNEFRAQSDDRERTFATKTEIDYKFASIEKVIDTHEQWERRIELKFSEYVTQVQWDRQQTSTGDWRRTVDAQLTAASSKSSMIYAIVAMAIAAGGLLIATFNLFSKASWFIH